MSDDRTQKSRSYDGLIALFIDRPVLTLMTTLTLCALGILSFARLPLRLTPADMVQGQLNLYIPVTQAMTPTEIQEQVLEPLEEQVRTIPGIAELRSRCDNDSAFLAIEFDTNTDVMLAAAEVRDRAQRAKLDWPRGVDRYFTWREDGSSAPLAFLQVLTPERNQTWADKLENVVKPRLERVDGVGQIEIWGLTAETLRIWFDREKLIAHRIDYGELLQRLSTDNFAQPIGEIDDGARRYLARVDSRFRTQAEIENFPIRTGLRIADVARVQRVPSLRDSLARFDGSYTYTAVLRMAAGSNPVEAGRAVRGVMDELKREPSLEGLSFRFLFDQGALIEDSLQTLLQTSVQGGLLALVALFAFLRNVRATIAIALSIPLALLIAGVYLFFAGRSLNLLTMAGMTLAVGLVVDNSVVVLENIRRRREQGLPMREAAIQGTREIILAITMATLTTVVVILPLVFMSSEGAIRAVLSALGLTLSVGLIGSLLVACFLLPSGVRHLSPNIGNRSAAAAHQHVRRRRSKWSPIAWLTAANRKLLHWSLRCRYAVVVGCALVVSTMYFAWEALDFEDKGGGPFQGGEVSIYLSLPNGRTLRDVAGVIREYEEFLDEHRDEWHIEHVSDRFDRTSARFDILFDDTIEREEFADYERRIRSAWPRKPGVALRMRERQSGQRGGATVDDKNSQNFVVRLWGADSEYLTDRAIEVAKRLSRRDEVATVEIDRIEGNREVVVAVDRQRLSDFGVSPTQLQRVMAGGLRGQELTRFQEGDRDVSLIAQFDSERNPTLQDLKETRVWSGRGDGFQRVGDMGEIQFESALESIRRIDARTTVQVTGTRAEGVTSKAFSDVLADVMAGVVMPRGYSWSEASYSGEIGEQLAEIGRASILSITLVFMLMGILFESVVLSAATLVTVPFALCGALWSLVLFFGSLDIMAGIGMLLLSGIVVNNGIVLLDCIERLRREGRSRTYAIVRGTRVRLRPIVMTAVTTIVGLLPMAIFGESSGQGISYVSMSIAIAGGLALSTVFTAFTVPLAYTFLDDLSQFGRSVLARALGPRKQSVVTPTNGSQFVSSAKPQSL